MGLDMYLDSYKGTKDDGTRLSFEAVKGFEAVYEDMYVPDNKELTAKTKEEFLKINGITSLINDRGSDAWSWMSFQKKEMYWRKANHIHMWFVNNVQSGEDDCNQYAVTKENLQELANICKEIIDKCPLVPGIIQNGSSSKPNQYAIDNNIKPNGFMYPCYEEGKVMTNQDIAEDLLPTDSGFFFGGTGYDEWYYGDTKETYEACEKLIKEFDFDTDYLVYQSSW